jgi:adenylyltransferase/sulfurtransferase
MHQHDLDQRYSRHLSLPEIGEEGQQQLKKTRVLIIGLGGLGCPLSLYLTASGIGHLGLVDDDRVSLSNLNRQILYETADINRPKTEAARDRLEELNPEITLKRHPTRLNKQNGAGLIADYDIICDGSDNAETRYLVNRLCHEARKPLISAAIHGWKGQLYSFHTAQDSTCYQCLFPDPPLPEETPNCADSGVLSPLAGMMGCWQASEVVKLAVGLSKPGKMWRVDMLKNDFSCSYISKDPSCEVCHSS